MTKPHPLSFEKSFDDDGRSSHSYVIRLDDSRPDDVHRRRKDLAMHALHPDLGSDNGTTSGNICTGKQAGKQAGHPPDSSDFQQVTNR